MRTLGSPGKSSAIAVTAALLLGSCSRPGTPPAQQPEPARPIARQPLDSAPVAPTRYDSIVQRSSSDRPIGQLTPADSAALDSLVRHLAADDTSFAALFANMARKQRSVGDALRKFYPDLVARRPASPAGVYLLFDERGSVVQHRSVSESLPTASVTRETVALALGIGPELLNEVGIVGGASVSAPGVWIAWGTLKANASR